MPPAPDIRADVVLAHALADEADSLTLARFGALDLVVEAKPDLTPVTDADREVEDRLRARVGAARPGDAVLGEERGQSGDAARRWIVDPIDGTKNFVRGLPVWATLIALEVDGSVQAGCVSAPALGVRWWAGRGLGCWTGRSLRGARRCRVSSVDRLADAFLSYAGLGGWQDVDRLPAMLALTRAVWRSRAFGDFYSHVLLAQGAVDVTAEPEVSLWDLAALQVLVEEAGGRFSDLSGAARPDGGSVVCTNTLLHDAVLAILNP